MSQLELAFLHIPKTAGTSQHGSFNRIYGKKNVFWIGNDCPGNVEQYPSELIGGATIVGGHKPLSFYPKRSQPLYCAVLRDPIARAISLFAYYTQPELARSAREREARAHQLDKMLKQGVDPGCMLTSISRSKAFRDTISNTQCAFLSRRGASLKTVQRSFKQYDFVVGTLDNYDDFHQTLGEILDWPPIDPGLTNRGQDNYAEKYLSDRELVAQLQLLNAEDIKLLNFINGRHGGLMVNIRNQTLHEERMARFPVITPRVNKKPNQWVLKAKELWPPSESKSFKLHLLPANTFVSESHKILYHKIPGLADNKMVGILLRYLMPQHEEIFRQLGPHRVLERYKTGLMLKDKTAEVAGKICDDSDYFNFAVLSDPVDRLVDAYRQNFVEHILKIAARPIIADVVASIQGVDTPDLEVGVSFRQFINFITRQSQDVQHPSWSPQHLFINPVRSKCRLYRADNVKPLQDDLMVHAGIEVDLTDPFGRAFPSVVKQAHSGDLIGRHADSMLPDFPKGRVVPREELLDYPLQESIESFYNKDYRLYRQIVEDQREARA